MAFLDRFRFKKKPFKEEVEIKSEIKPEAKKKAKAEKPAAKKIEPVETKPEAKIASTLMTSSLSGVLVRPYLSEKSNLQAEKSKFVFEVKADATKGQVGQAVRELYGVIPLKIAMIKMNGKIVRYGRTIGQTKNWKKAIVTLPEGKKIDIYK